MRSKWWSIGVCLALVLWSSWASADEPCAELACPEGTTVEAYRDAVKPPRIRWVCSTGSETAPRAVGPYVICDGDEVAETGTYDETGARTGVRELFEDGELTHRFYIRDGKNLHCDVEDGVETCQLFQFDMGCDLDAMKNKRGYLFDTPEEAYTELCGTSPAADAAPDRAPRRFPSRWGGTLQDAKDSHPPTWDQERFRLAVASIDRPDYGDRPYGAVQSVTIVAKTRSATLRLVFAPKCPGPRHKYEPADAYAHRLASRKAPVIFAYLVSKSVKKLEVRVRKTGEDLDAEACRRPGDPPSHDRPTVNSSEEK